MSFDIENLGCKATSAPWSIDAGPGSLASGTTALQPGELRTINRSLDVTSPSGKVTVSVDPNDTVAECSELLGPQCAVAGVHVVELQACTGCVTPGPPTDVIGNSVRAIRDGTGAELSWMSAPDLSAAQASHFHVYQSDQKSGGPWTNLPVPDTLVIKRVVDAAPPGPLDFYQVRFSNDCEEFSGGPLP